MAGDSDEEGEDSTGGQPSSPPATGLTAGPTGPTTTPTVPPTPASAAPGPAANYRIAVAAIWVALQILLVVTADRRVDGAFGFRMFAESAVVKVVLYREVLDPSGRPQRIHVDGGVWAARGPDGVLRRMTWYDRVPSPFWAFDQEMHASYGSATQLARLQGALDDVSTHIPDDAETQRLILVVSIKRNGREAVTTQLVGPLLKLDRPAAADGGAH